METKKIIHALKCCSDMDKCEECECRGFGLFCDEILQRKAAERLEELEKKNAKLKAENDARKLFCEKKDEINKDLYRSLISMEQKLSEKQPEWISVEDGKEMPDAFSYTGIRHDQFPRLVIVTDENRKVTHWMMLDAPKPKVPTFKDVFLKRFPKASNVCFKDYCPKSIFESIKCPLPSFCTENDKEKCWNQSYFEEEEGEANA